MTYNTIGICSANVERSGLFEASTNYELNERGINDIVATSAGINVEKILTNTSALPIQVKILGAGLKYGVVRPEIKNQVEKVVSQGTEQEHTDKIRALYAEVRPLVHGYLLAFRNQALTEVGITNFPAPYKPFDPTAGHDLVLPMTAGGVKKVATRFDTAGLEKPTIQTYGSFVGVEELVDDVKSGLDGARRKLTYFMDTRKKAVDNLLELRG